MQPTQQQQQHFVSFIFFLSAPKTRRPTEATKNLVTQQQVRPTTKRANAVKNQQRHAFTVFPERETPVRTPSQLFQRRNSNGIFLEKIMRSLLRLLLGLVLLLAHADSGQLHLVAGHAPLAVGAGCGHLLSDIFVVGQGVQGSTSLRNDSLGVGVCDKNTHLRRSTKYVLEGSGAEP